MHTPSATCAVADSKAAAAGAAGKVPVQFAHAGKCDHSGAGADTQPKAELVKEVTFVGVNADSTGCCRFDDQGYDASGHNLDADGQDNYELLGDVTSPDGCKSLCLADADCKSFEVSAWEGCELHKGVATWATSTVGCTCMKKEVSSTQVIVTTTAPAPTTTVPATTTDAPATTQVIVTTTAPATTTNAPATTTNAPTTTDAPTTPATTVASVKEGESTTSCTKVDNYDYGGHDLPDGMGKQTDSFEECASNCAKHPKCTYFARTIWGQCYLKTEAAGANGVVATWASAGHCPQGAVVPDAPATTEIEIEVVSFEVFGGAGSSTGCCRDKEGTEATSSAYDVKGSLQECQEHCESEQECTAIEYHDWENSCEVRKKDLFILQSFHSAGGQVELSLRMYAVARRPCVCRVKDALVYPYVSACNMI